MLPSRSDLTCYTSFSYRYDFDHFGKRGYLNRLRKALRKTLKHKKKLHRINDPSIRKDVFGRPKKYRLTTQRMSYLRY